MKTLIILTASLFSLNALSHSLIENAMTVLAQKKELTPTQKKASKAIFKYSKEYGVDYKIILGIMMTESSLNQNAVSHTEDYGIGQINYKMWSIEFKRLKKDPLNKEKLIHDVDYAVKRTTEILAILKKTNDPLWFARYHSKTPSKKIAYFNKVQKEITKITANYHVKVASK